MYYTKGFARMIVPNLICRAQLQKLLKEAYSREDINVIKARVNYYCRLSSVDDFDHEGWNQHALALWEQKMTRQKVYYIDSMEYARFFPKRMKWMLLPGDITFVPMLPSIVKSRPIGSDNKNSVLLNLDKIRHFIFVNDKKSFQEKKDMIIFRGKVGGKKQRKVFMKKFSGHPMFNVGAVDDEVQLWKSPKMTISEHLNYKFIMCIEGNDVASNLKWVMSSNSIAVMPKPTCETWFMEGTLQPDCHYIEVKPDFSDLIEKTRYYIEHPHKALAIIEHAHEYVHQFLDKKREKLVSLMVLEKYFSITNESVLISDKTKKQ